VLTCSLLCTGINALDTVCVHGCLQVGVEHLLRDINDPSTSTLANQIKHKMAALSGLRERLEEVQVYLARVLAGTLPVNNQIVYNLQDIFNLLPNLNAEVMLAV
jgi:26S proteasome regulatory subunit N8